MCEFNFLMSDGEHLIAYGHDRLHRLQHRRRDQETTVLASEPVTDDEPWEAFQPGELQVFRGGELLGILQTKAGQDRVGSAQCAEK